MRVRVVDYNLRERERETEKKQHLSESDDERARLCEFVCLCVIHFIF